MSEEMSKESSAQSCDVENAAEPEESFAALLENSKNIFGRLEPGQKVKSKIISISDDLAYIDLGTKSEGIIDVNELVDDNGDLIVKEGDEIEASFVTMQNGMKKMTTLIHGYTPIQLDEIRSAYNAGLPIKCDIKREVKGGFEVSAGGVRCFCPFSQIDLKGGREGGVYLGQTFSFKVLEYKDEGGLNIVVSRRALLEDEKQEQIKRLKETLKVGMDVTAHINSIHKFGVFVTLGGIDGFIPVSEVSWERIVSPVNTLTLGEKVTTRVLSLDWDKNRITLSIKATQPDPWLNVSDRYAIDSRVKGEIVRLAQFGAFVKLEPGLEGLIHISNLRTGRRINHPKEAVEVGQMIEAYVLSVDAQSRKISLSLQPKPKPKQIDFPAEGELVEGIVEKVMPFGVFMKMKNGLTGLIPNHEMGTSRGTDHGKMFPIGSTMQVVVIEVDTGQKKIKLSRKGLMEKAEQEEVDQYRNAMKEQEDSSESFGSFGKLLKAKMEEKNFTL
jgi:small subunit ribosomal protein S1